MRWADMKRPQLQSEVSKMYAGQSNPAGGWGKYSNEEIRDLLHAGHRAQRDGQELPVIPMPKSLSSGVESHEPPQVSAPVSQSSEPTDAAVQLAQLLSQLAGKGATVDMSQVEAMVDGKLAELGAARRVIVEPKPDVEVEVGLTHRQFDELLQEVLDGRNVFLVGPAASGKTHVSDQVANALGLKFYPQSVCLQTTKSDLLGFVHAGGECVRTPFREAYENGGVYLLDEVDNGNANVLNVLNAATSNGVCTFPDGPVKRHPDFRLIAAGNTTGHGADRVYVGRQQLDEALLSRFCLIHWTHDEELDKALYPDVMTWVTYVHRVIRALDSMPAATRPRTVVCSRNIEQGSDRARRGESVESLAERYIWRKFSKDDRQQVEKALA